MIERGVPTMATTPRSSHAPARPVGIKDIAKALGVSIGTVDRALHDKPGINALTRARVLSMAEAMGYRPNLAARHLKSPRTFRIAVHLPREIALFWDSLRDGILEAAAPYEPSIHVEFGVYPRLGEGDVPLFKAALDRNVNGLIIAPGDPTALRPWIRRAAKQNVPVVCVVTDAPGTERLTSVSADPFTVGAVAGEMMSRFLPAGGPVAFFTGWLGTQDHADKLRGFEANLRPGPGGLALAAVVEAHDEERAGHRRALNVLKANPKLKGIYVSTVNSLPVLEAVREMGRQHDLTVVTTDLFPSLLSWIRDGSVAATVYQRPLSQGRLALQALREFLVNGRHPSPRIKVVPHLVMRSNLDLILERLRVDLEAPNGRSAASLPD
jgi:LacI family transcriptional regulator